MPSAPETSTVGHSKGAQEAHIGLASGRDPEKSPLSALLRQEGTNARASHPWAILNARPLCISTQPWNPAGHQETGAPTPALPSLVCDADQDLGPSALFQVAELEDLQGPELPDLCDFRFPWDLVRLSAEAESGTSSHPILLVSTEGGSPGREDDGRGLRILVSSAAVQAGAGLAHSPTDPN